MRIHTHKEIHVEQREEGREIDYQSGKDRREWNSQKLWGFAAPISSSKNAASLQEREEDLVEILERERKSTRRARSLSVKEKEQVGEFYRGERVWIWKPRWAKQNGTGFANRD